MTPKGHVLIISWRPLSPEPTLAPRGPEVGRPVRENGPAERPAPYEPASTGPTSLTSGR